MRATLKIASTTLDAMREHLRKPHPIAFERVGFLACRGGNTRRGCVLVALEFLPVADEDYEDDPTAGATISANAIRVALEFALRGAEAMLFVHEHAHRGRPRPSDTDERSWNELIPSFGYVRPGLPHGALILSHDSAMGRLWMPGGGRRPIDEFVVVGQHLERWRGGKS